MSKTIPIMIENPDSMEENFGGAFSPKTDADRYSTEGELGAKRNPKDLSEIGGSSHDQYKTLIFSLFSSDHFVDKIAFAFSYDKLNIVHRQFPDDETYLRYDTLLEGSHIIIVDTLDQPNHKILPLIFAAQTAKELGAITVGLIAPYLSYMRQDKRFHPGEAITSKTFATLISQNFDWMMTVDPHLHRYHALSDIYTIPTTVVPAAPTLSTWIAKQIDSPILIGPDEESRQWVSQIAQNINCPYTILEKKRLGDENVEISIPSIETFISHTPVLVDDIVSTGQTMIKTIQHLKSLGTKPPVCAIVHPLFAGITTNTLIQAGAKRVVSCNTIAHDSNEPALDLSQNLIEGLSFLI